MPVRQRYESRPVRREYDVGELHVTLRSWPTVTWEGESLNTECDYASRDCAPFKSGSPTHGPLNLPRRRIVNRLWPLRVTTQATTRTSWTPFLNSTTKTAVHAPAGRAVRLKDLQLH